MSYLENLPEEILIIITKQLDIKSQFNLYQTCKRMQSILSMNGVITACNFSLSTLATANSLQLNVFKVISGHVCKLNLSGVSDLTLKSLIQALKKMKCLKTLDVSYTRIVMEDIYDIHKICPTIKNIAMDYLFKDCLQLTKGGETLRNCQKVFKNFTDIHLVMRGDSFQKPVVILSESAPYNLTFTFCDWKYIIYLEEIIAICKYNHLSIFIFCMEPLHVHQTNYSSSRLFFPLFQSKNIEYIVFHYDNIYSIWASPKFEEFLSENFTIKSLSFVKFNSYDTQNIILGNVGMFIWVKATNTFDNLFYCNLKKRIKKIFTYRVDVTNAESKQLCVDAKNYEAFKIYQTQNTNKADNSEPDFKRKRCVSSSLALNYDNIFCFHETVDLSIYFCNSGIVTLSATNDFLRKLTYLSLAGCTVRYSNEFFNILFRSCENLTTLNVESSSVYPCSGAIARTIPLSQSLKNIRILDKRIDFNTLFSSFTQCTLLENIYVVDTSTDFSGLPNPTLMFKKCTNLYNLYIEGIFSDAKKRQLFRILNTAKKKCSMDYLNLTLQTVNARIAYTHTPYINVFNLFPIKPV